MKILFVGDVMPGGVLPYQDKYIVKELLDYMRGFDLRVGTLETAVGTNLPFDEEKMKGRKNIIYCRDEDFYRVKEMNFNVVSLANNHLFDLGIEGYKNTVRHLEENGIKYCGAGMNIGEAAKPAVIEHNGETVAFFAFCVTDFDYLGYVPIATENHYGINPFCITKVVECIKDAKTRYDKVFVLPHWGLEYSWYPLKHDIQYAKMMIKAGADGVFGSHAHHIQPIYSVKRKPCAFGMGNFLFPDYYMDVPRPIGYPLSISEETPRVIGYPRNIEIPTISVWNPESRVGMIVAIDTQSKCKKNNKALFVELTADNQLRMCLSKQRRLKLVSLVTRMPCSHIIRSTISLMKRIGKKILSK